MVLPESGQYVVPDALDFVEIDCEKETWPFAPTGAIRRPPTLPSDGFQAVPPRLMNVITSIL
jgi:hypothetical protein